MTALLDVRDLTVRFRVPGGVLTAVDGVSLQVARGETLGLVGESGSGKSTLALALMRARAAAHGSVLFDGQDALALNGAALKALRRRMQMVFQNPYASLDPRMTIGRILAEPLEAHAIGTRAERRAAVLDLLHRVGLNADAAPRYPAQFSGGQRQRIAIARALALRPELLILDEPVSALDVSIQAQIVNLLRDLQAEFRIAYLIIAHDLPLVHQVSDRIAVLYLGRVVETGSADAVVARPQHPYTAALMSASPARDAGERRQRIVLTGESPSPIDRPTGCAFHPRCPIATARCASEAPLLAQTAAGHFAACHYPGKIPPPVALIH
jgi:oligopeptide/dipeptide ABC transporter ATP-binding protein